MVTLELLGTIEAFNGMDQGQLSKLQPNCKELDFNQGDKLFTEGDSAEHLWIVVKGRVDLRFELPAGRPPHKNVLYLRLTLTKGILLPRHSGGRVLCRLTK